MKNCLAVLSWLLAFTAGAQTPSLKKSPFLAEGTPESVGMSAQRLARIAAVGRPSTRARCRAWWPWWPATTRSCITKHLAWRTTPQGFKAGRHLPDRLPDQGHHRHRRDDVVGGRQIRVGRPDFQFHPRISKIRRCSKRFSTATRPTCTEPAKSEITIRQLLTHTSGLGYGVIDGDERFKMLYQKAGVTDLFTTENIPIGESVKKLAKLPLHHQPGGKVPPTARASTRYLIEVVSGMTFDAFLKKRLFEPLGMRDTWFYLPDDKASRLVSVQWPDQGKWGVLSGHLL